MPEFLMKPNFDRNQRKRGGYKHAVRTLTSYKFNECNGYGSIAWYDTSAYSPKSTLQNKMGTISKAYNELSRTAP